MNAALATLTFAAPVNGASAVVTVPANDGSLTNNLRNTVTTTISLAVTEVKISTTVSINAAGNIEIKDNVEWNGIEFVRLAQCAEVEHEADYDAGKHCQRLNTPQ